MNLKTEHAIIAILAIALAYFIYEHQSVLSDLFQLPDNGNQQLKSVKGKHGACGFWCILDKFVD